MTRDAETMTGGIHQDHMAAGYMINLISHTVHNPDKFIS